MNTCDDYLQAVPTFTIVLLNNGVEDTDTEASDFITVSEAAGLVIAYDNMPQN